MFWSSTAILWPTCRCSPTRPGSRPYGGPAPSSKADGPAAVLERTISAAMIGALTAADDRVVTTFTTRWRAGSSTG
jgi:hypothetical protein